MIESPRLFRANVGRLLGGLVMFAIEGAIVAGLFLVALAISSVIVAIL